MGKAQGFSRDTPGILQGYWAPVSAPTTALHPPRGGERLWCDSSFKVPVLGQINLVVDSVTSQLRLLRACPCLSVPLCKVAVDGTQNKCPIPAQLEMTASRSSPQGVLLSLFSVCRHTELITAFPSPQGDFTKHIFMPRLACCSRDCLDEAASIWWKPKAEPGSPLEHSSPTPLSPQTPRLGRANS